jgi:hypothetical protein
MVYNLKSRAFSNFSYGIISTVKERQVMVVGAGALHLYGYV